MAPHSSTLAWKIPWAEEHGRLQSMGSWRVGHDWVTSLSCIGEGNGNPLQYSCLENPRDGRAWWAAVYGVAQSWIQLKRLSGSSIHTHTYINVHVPVWPLSPFLPPFLLSPFPPSIHLSSWIFGISITQSLPVWVTAIEHGGTILRASKDEVFCFLSFHWLLLGLHAVSSVVSNSIFETPWTVAC